MRLLELQPSGELLLTEKFLDDAIPPYAILSHTWGSQEVTFEDIIYGLGRNKAGYDKIKFCGKQAARDSLQYFWVDTCCIKKSSDAELSESINSMFRWYRRAKKCYVYLSDVSISKRERGNENALNTWEQAFRKSRWFTRGWTLQELFAPLSVEFFSKEDSRLGDKKSLEQQIHEVTGISISAFPGSALSQFSTDQKFDWAKNRKTTHDEDWAYFLLGIFEISMPVIYGEGRTNAVKRLRKEVDGASDDKECLRHLYVTDPRADKTRIEEAKGPLIPDSYHWILENCDFKQWRNNQESRLLWIKGDPGKGKTMLLCGIIDELKKSTAETYILSYFFCQATDSRINNATAVLRGLLYLLIEQQPSLISHIRKQHDHAGKTLFEDANASVTLSNIFTNVLQDPSLKSTYLIIDALDECMIGLPKLLNFIVQKSSVSARVKWLVSSRNWPHIKEHLSVATQKTTLCLELNENSISAAVSIYIQLKVDQLARLKKYDNKTHNAVRHHLMLNTQNTFLWVALVCQDLAKISRWKTLEKLTAFPPGLNALYSRMMDQICDSDDAKLCQCILAVVSTVYRPVTLDELTSFVDVPDTVSGDHEALAEIIGLCGSFLILCERTISFVHQSAKDFLLKETSSEIFPSGVGDIHHVILSRSLQVMSTTLRRDIYSLSALGYSIEEVNQPDPDPLAASRYSCIYWVNHLCDCNSDCHADHRVDLQDRGIVDVFMREKLLYWLEALSLCKSMAKGVLSMAKLEAVIKGRADAPLLLELLRDARRFILYHKQVIEISPLQKEEPKWFTVKPAMRGEWNACLQTLEGHSDQVFSVAFSHDSTRLASGSLDYTIRIWNVDSGDCLQTLEGHIEEIASVAFSHDSTRLVSASSDYTIKIWDAGSGDCLRTLKGHSDWVRSVAFSHDSMRLASASLDETVKIWDSGSGACLQTVDVGRTLHNISFDTTGLCLLTDIGAVALDTLSTSKITPEQIEPQSPRYRGVAVSSDRAWVTHDLRKRIWLPPEYRPMCSAISGRTIGIGTGSGRVWMCTL